MNKTLKQSIPIAEAFSKLLHPFAEVVIHDIKLNQIAYICNSFSQREVGDNSCLDNWDFTKHHSENVIGPYSKTNYDGRNLKSISLVLRDSCQKAIGLLCVNMDISVFESHQHMIRMFLTNNDSGISTKKHEAFKDDFYEQISIFVHNYCREKQIHLDALSRQEKQQLVTTLHEKGAFNGKNATQYIARILNISRATVYNYLKKDSGDDS